MQSLLVSQWEDVQLGADLATALLTPTYLKQVNWHPRVLTCLTGLYSFCSPFQILNPLLLLYIEFWHT